MNTEDIDKLIHDSEVGAKRLYSRRQELEGQRQAINNQIVLVEQAMIKSDGELESLAKVKSLLDKRLSDDGK